MNKPNSGQSEPGAAARCRSQLSYQCADKQQAQTFALFSRTASDLTLLTWAVWRMDGAGRLGNPMLCTPGESSTQVVAHVDPGARVRHVGEPVLDVYRESHLVVLAAYRRAMHVWTFSIRAVWPMPFMDCQTSPKMLLLSSSVLNRLISERIVSRVNWSAVCRNSYKELGSCAS
jgi:hypothetical protein